jgi:hypothetical protein
VNESAAGCLEPPFKTEPLDFAPLVEFGQFSSSRAGCTLKGIFAAISAAAGCINTEACIVASIVASSVIG